MSLQATLRKLWARMHWRKSAQASSPVFVPLPPKTPDDSHGVEMQTAVEWMKSRGIIPSPQAQQLNIPTTLNTQHRERFMEIGPDVWIFSNADHDIVLEGVMIKSLVVPARRQVKIKSPVLEPVHTLNRGMMLREWDALFVANELIENYCRGRWYDLADPEDLRTCTLPFPKRSLARIAEKIGLRAERESNPVKAG